MEFIKKRAVPILVGILFFHFILSLVVSSQESMTYDEKAHIPASYSYVKYGDMRLNPEHPPLLKDFAGLFLLPFKLDFPLQSTEWQDGANEQWSVGDMFINCTRPELACNDAEQVLFFSRIPTTLIAALLGIVLFLWTRELGGTLAGVFAVTLYAFDPNIIAHNHYVTTDIGSAAFIFFAFYFFVRFLKAPSRNNILLAGLFLGLAELVKFSAVLVFPVFGLFTLLFAIAKIKSGQVFQTLFSYAWKFLAIIIICFATIWVVYGLNTIGMPRERVIAHADLFLSQPNAPARIAHDLIVQMSASPLLLPMAEYSVGMAKVFSRVAAGNTHYFLGTVGEDASPWYFPVIFFLKETLPFLFLLLATTSYSLYRIVKLFLKEKYAGIARFLSHSLQSRIAQYLGAFFVLFYSYISITGNLNIGFRHLFPILPFLYMLIGKTLADFYKRHSKESTTRQMMGGLIGILMLCIVVIPLLSYPSYLSYFNAAAGGHTKGYLYATDSNYDWGQDLKYLGHWVNQYNNCQESKSPEQCLNSELDLNHEATQNLPKEAIGKIRVDYFGGSDPKYYLGDKYTSWWGGRTPEAGWYAISSFFYQESLYKKRAPGEQNYTWLTNKNPLARAGDSFFIYYISEEQVK